MCFKLTNNNDTDGSRIMDIYKRNDLIIIDFLVGNEPSKVGHYHPFYITDNAEGGFGQKDDLEQRKQRVFAGIVYDSEGYPFPTTGIILLLLFL